mmetsp:Transcript_26609/g.42176  ORF Transcript_26609/g.42176 Transcript_26609/m.42176 type:complete len:221 (+) Transcript_26609:782-1444(+)
MVRKAVWYFLISAQVILVAFRSEYKSIVSWASDLASFADCANLAFSTIAFVGQPSFSFIVSAFSRRERGRLPLASRNTRSFWIDIFLSIGSAELFGSSPKPFRVDSESFCLSSFSSSSTCMSRLLACFVIARDVSIEAKSPFPSARNAFQKRSKEDIGSWSINKTGSCAEHDILMLSSTEQPSSISISPTCSSTNFNFAARVTIVSRVVRIPFISKGAPL